MIKRRIRFVSIMLIALTLPALAGCGNVFAPLTPTATSTATVTATATLTPTLTPTPTLTQIPAACGGPREMLILLIGSDARRDNYTTGLADAIRLVRVDFVHPGIRLIAFPRDMYVEIPGIAENSRITHGKLNQAYLYGNPGYKYYTGPGQGPGLLAATLALNFDARVDHYVAVNVQTFARAVDALGGINIDMPYTLDGRVPRSFDPNRYFPAGIQHLDGYRTMLLARMRPQGDFERMEIQNLILRALLRKLSSPAMLLRLPTLIGNFHSSVQTDLGPVELSYLACLAAMIDSRDIAFESFPEDLFTVARVQDPVLGNTSILDADFEVLSSYVRKFQAGLALPAEDDKRWIDP